MDFSNIGPDEIDHSSLSVIYRQLTVAEAESEKFTDS